MIRFLSVSKKYSDEITALDNVSFEVQDGEFVFLVGPSGSGKTTAIKLLIREEIPDEGRIFFEDLDLADISRDLVYELRRRVGVIFQDFKLLEDKDAYENVSFALEAAGKSDNDIKETVPYVLEIVGLKDRMDAFPRELSGGEKQKVAIARALANNPKVLIADEPTGNLDPTSTWDIVQVLNKINNWGTTIIMATHGSEIVNTLGKRVIRMEGGRLIRDDIKGTYDPVEDFETKILVNTQLTKEKDQQRKDEKPVSAPPSQEKSEKKEKTETNIGKNEGQSEQKSRREKPKRKKVKIGIKNKQKKNNN
ncbi:ATP-binding cassette domain-containing protein [Candidatus Dojkabacteria bacterium]|nr:ATP-binding cassette domain-containing protein [Candidatus Dojkabacteria bacterium]